jgi:Protein of unknown function (DUF3040)
VALDPAERARLARIETELAGSDPGLVARFRRWRPTTESEVTRSGWSTVPVWMLVVFLVGFGSWTVGPWLGGLVVAVAGCRVARDRMRRRGGGRVGPAQGPQRKPDRR